MKLSISHRVDTTMVSPFYLPSNFYRGASPTTETEEPGRRLEGSLAKAPTGPDTGPVRT